jgi:4'-phosphopantetheinyl transferase
MSVDATFGDDAPRVVTSPHAGVSLWWVTLDAPEARRATFERWLSAPERARMARFGTDALRERYLVGRATLRWLLARALGVSPERVAIERGERGRPRLAHATDLDFNVTHTGHHGMIGLASGLRVGVDIERRDRVINAPGIARKFMTQAERAALPADADAARRQLLRLWTCKEAMSKATGDGVSAPFGRIDVALMPTLRVAGGPAAYAPGAWSLHSVDASPAHFATVALWRGAVPPSPSSRELTLGPGRPG